jgi:hypothetical protein
MAVYCGQLATVNHLQLLDDGASVFRKRRLALEGVQDNPFKKISKAQIGVFSEAFQYFEQG